MYHILNGLFSCTFLIRDIVSKTTYYGIHATFQSCSCTVPYVRHVQKAKIDEISKIVKNNSLPLSLGLPCGILACMYGTAHTYVRTGNGIRVPVCCYMLSTYVRTCCYVLFFWIYLCRIRTNTFIHSCILTKSQKRMYRYVLVPNCAIYVPTNRYSQYFRKKSKTTNYNIRTFTISYSHLS